MAQSVTGTGVSAGWPREPAAPLPPPPPPAGARAPLKSAAEQPRAAGYLVAVGSRTARFRGRHARSLTLVPLCALLLLLLLLVIILSLLYSAARAPRVLVCESAACLRSAANLAFSMDPAADPCTDFYQYTCGRWGAEHPRPEGLVAYDWFRDTQARVYARLRDFLEGEDNASAPQPQPAPLRHARTMYSACMDLETLEQVGLRPALEVLRAVGLEGAPRLLAARAAGAAGAAPDWVAVSAAARGRLAMELLVGFDLLTDPRNATTIRLALGSPEVDDPFPGMKIERQRHSKKRSRLVPKLDPVDFSFVFDEKHRFEDSGGEEEEVKRVEENKAALYAELIWIFARESQSGTRSEQRNAARHAAETFLTVSEYLHQLETNSSEEAGMDEESYEYWEWDIGEYTAEELETATGARGGEWARYLRGVFAAADAPADARPDLATDTVLVSPPDLRYLTLLLAYVTTLPPDTLELYLWVKVVEAVAAHTTAEARRVARRIENVVRREANPTAPPAAEHSRSLHCATVVNDLLGMALAYAIADPSFLNETKPKVEGMIEEIKNALAHLVGRAHWMDDNTKVATYDKILAMRALVGFPEWLLEAGALERHYAGVTAAARAHLANMAAALTAHTRRALAAFHRPHNVTWATEPTEVNAYHTFQENTITVPMVMLQYPFFDLGLDSLNYGALGAILGHEITHGFDNYGRRFDKDGNLRSWWSNATAAAFENVSQCFVNQYSRYYIPELDEYVDGRQTLGENMADTGGLREALVALRRRTATAPPPALPGFQNYTHEQLFFLSYGNAEEEWDSRRTNKKLDSEKAFACDSRSYRRRGAAASWPSVGLYVYRSDNVIEGVRPMMPATINVGCTCLPTQIELWCGSWTAAGLAGELRDSHAPQRVRPGGALANSPHFAAAWRCHPPPPPCALF